MGLPVRHRTAQRAHIYLVERRHCLIHEYEMVELKAEAPSMDSPLPPARCRPVLEHRPYPRFDNRCPGWGPAIASLLILLLRSIGYTFSCSHSSNSSTPTAFDPMGTREGVSQTVHRAEQAVVD